MQYLLWPLSEQFQNKNGSILTNGKVYVYYRGRTALATTWSDEDGTVENPQPIILDDNGRAACYVNPAYYYTVVVCDFYGKELFSYDISLHDGTGTGDNNIEITSSDHSIMIDKSSIIDGYRYDEKVNPEFVAEVAVSAVSDLIPDYINEDRTIVIKDRSEYDTKTKLVSTDMQSVMIRQQINNSSSEYKYSKICEADINTNTWINEWMTTLQLSFQSNGAYYSGKSSGIFVLNCENYLTQSGYSQRHEEDGKWLLFDKDTKSPQISKLYLYWRDDFSSQHYELWGEFNNLKYYEGVGVAALINCSLRNHLTSSLPIDQERNIWRFNPIGIETLKNALPTDSGSLVKSFDPADADIKPIAEPDPGTFYATYVYNGPASGNTSFEDIKAAYDSGKSVYVNYKENTDSKDTEVYSLVWFRDTPIGRPDLSCFYFTNMRTGTNKTIYRFPSNWGKMDDKNFASSDSVWDLQHAIATDYQLLPIPSPSGTYAVYGFHLYKSREEITEETSFDPTQWQEITVMDEVQSLVASSSGTTDVFIAKYQVTPVSSVFEAVDEGKFVWVSLGSDGHGPFLPMNVTSTTEGSTSYVRFEGLYFYDYGQGNEGRQVLVTAANSEGWEGVTTTNIASKELVLSTVSGASSVLETEIQTVSSAIDTISGQNGVFIAEYGTTTFEEIGEAVADGKAVFGKGHPYNSDMLLPISSFTSPRPSIAIFAGIVGNYEYSIKLDGTTWSNDSIVLANNEDVVNADWDATSGKAEILNKPDIEPVSAGTGIEIVEVSGTMVISSTGGGSNYEAGQYISIVNDQISATGLVDQSTYNTDTVKYESAYSTVESNSAIWNEAQVNADWEATSGVAEILNKPTLTPVSGGTGIEIVKADGKIVISATGSTVPASGVFFAEYGVTTLAEVQAAMEEGKEVIAYRSSFEAVTEVSYAYMESSYNNDTYIIFAQDFINDRTNQRYKWELTSSGWTTTEIFDYVPAASGIRVVNDSQNIPTLIAKVDGTTININSAGQLEAVGGSSTVHTSSNLKGDGTSSDPLDLNSVIDIGGYPETSHHTYINDEGVVSAMVVAPEYYDWSISPISGLSIFSKYDEDGTTGPINRLIGRDIIALHGIETSASIWNEAAAMDEYPISAGPGIKIEDVDDVTVFSTDGVMMEADIAYNGQGEISGYNGSPIMTVDSEKQWLTHDDTIAHVTNSAQYAFGVNVPVVAQAMGTDETVLYSGPNVAPSSTAIALSGNINDFNSVKFYWTANNYVGDIVDEVQCDNNTTQLTFMHPAGASNLWIQFLALNCPTGVNKNSLTLLAAKQINFGAWSSTSWSTPTMNTNVGDTFQLSKVVGIGRKENT